jgi:hypothetical protein
MKTEPQEPTWLKPLGGIVLGFTISAAFLGSAGWLVGIPWLYTLAFVGGTALLRTVNQRPRTPSARGPAVG